MCLKVFENLKTKQIWHCKQTRFIFERKKKKSNFENENKTWVRIVKIEVVVKWKAHDEIIVHCACLVWSDSHRCVYLWM